MAKTKKNAYRSLVAWMLVLLVLAVLCCAGYLMTKNALKQREQDHIKAVEQTNQQLTDEYNAAVAEMKRQEEEAAQANENKQWPEAAASGWDVVDLSAYAVNRGKEVSVTRREMLEGGLLVVNRWHLMPADLLDEYMVSANQYSRREEAEKTEKLPTHDAAVSLQVPAIEALMKMYSEARAQGLDMDNIIIQYGYRTMEEQSKLWNDTVTKYSSRYSGDTLTERARKETAYPGSSDYQTGLSIFLYNYKSGDKAFSSTPLHETEQGKWIYNNCWKYGYVFRFPVAGFPYKDTVDKSYKTGINLDSHKVYRYVGVANAAAMNTLGFCLEEYVEYLMEHPHIAVYQDGTLKHEIYRMEGGNADTTVNIPNGAASYSVSSDNMNGLVVSISY